MSFAWFSRNIPDEAHKKIGEMGPAGVQVFAFAPGGGWVLVVNNGYFARGIPDECFQKPRCLVFSHLWDFGSQSRTRLRSNRFPTPT